MKKFIVFPVLLFFVLITLSNANAVVQVVDADASADANTLAFNSGIVATGGETGDDEAGDYVLLMCGTNGQGPNSFFPPSPGDWTELDTGQCGGPECIQGVWGSFTDTAAIEDITCSWSEGHFVFVGGTFRYRDVDVNNPIINIACQSGTGEEAVAPSIISEPRSQVVRLATFSVPDGFGCEFELEQITAGEIDVCANAEIENVSLSAFTITGFEGGPTGEATLDLPDEETEWRACTVALRMAPTPIPTLNEWGFMAVAAFMGITGIWFLRRRQAQGA